MSEFNPRSNEGRPDYAAMEDEKDEKVALLAKRDAILVSLRTQFKAKVVGIQLRNADAGRLTVRLTMDAPAVDAFLLDLANNLAQGLS